MLCSINTNHSLFWLLNFLNTRFLADLFLLSLPFPFFGSMRLKIYDIYCPSFREKYSSPSLVCLWHLEDSLNLHDAYYTSYLFYFLVNWFYYIINTHNWNGAHLVSIAVAWCTIIFILWKVSPDIKTAGTSSRCLSSKLSLSLSPVPEVLYLKTGKVHMKKHIEFRCLRQQMLVENKCLLFACSKDETVCIYAGNISSTAAVVPCSLMVWQLKGDLPL